MKLTEDIAKMLLRERSLPVSQGGAATTAEGAAVLARQYGGAVAVKALIPAGRRGKAGLVRLAASEEAAKDAANEILGVEALGVKVERVYVECQVDIAEELYLSIIFSDRAPRLLISCHGGVDIESVHMENPEKIVVVEIDPTRGVTPWQAIEHWSRAGLTGRSLATIGGLTARLYKAFVDLDAIMMEINPLAIDSTGAPVIVGLMLEIDDFALYRHPRLTNSVEVLAPRNEREAAVERANRDYPGGDTRYVELDGNIGLLVAGGGAGLLQHDIIVSMGGRPANHSDWSPAPGSEKLEAVLDAIFTNPKARSLLIGSNYLQMARCDSVARALKISVERNHIDAECFPIVLRLFGPAEEEARKIVATIPGANYLPYGATLKDGCQTIVEITRQFSDMEINL